MTPPKDAHVRTAVRFIGFVVLSMLAVLAASACRRTVTEGPAEARVEERIISQILETEDPLVLDVRWFPSGCEEFERVDVETDETSVSFTVFAFVDSANCAIGTGESSARVELTEPIADRTVFDGNLGTTVALNEPPQPPELDS